VSHIAVSMVRSRIAMHVKFNIYAGVIPGFWCLGCETRTEKHGSHTRIAVHMRTPNIVAVTSYQKYLTVF
jgi:hypothetical protein